MGRTVSGPSEILEEECGYVASVVGVERWRVSGLNDEELVGETYVSNEEVR